MDLTIQIKDRRIFCTDKEQIERLILSIYGSPLDPYKPFAVNTEIRIVYNQIQSAWEIRSTEMRKHSKCTYISCG